MEAKQERHMIPAELRVSRKEGKKTGKITGYAAVFDKRSLDLGGFFEVIAPGAFGKVLADKPDVRALFNHDANQIFARTTNETLRLSEDGKGLKIEADLPDIELGRTLEVLIGNGTISQMSFAFSLPDEGDDDVEAWSHTGDDVYVRTIKRIGALYDISPVSFPAYLDTSVALRSLEIARQRETNPDMGRLAMLDSLKKQGEDQKAMKRKALIDGIYAKRGLNG